MQANFWLPSLLFRDMKLCAIGIISYIVFTLYRVTYVTGLLPQEVIGSPVFELFADDDTNQLRELLRMTTKTDEKIVSPILSIQTINQTPISVRVVLSVFKNPLTSELEHTLLDVTAVASYTKSTGTPSMDSKPFNEIHSPDKPHESDSVCDSSVRSTSSYEVEEDLRAEASRAVMMNFLGHDGGLGDVDTGQNLGWPFT